MALDRTLRGLVLLAASVLLAGCSGWGEKEDITKNWSAQRLYAAAKEQLDNGEYETAIDYYQKLESRYPFGPLAEQAQIEVAYAYYRYDEPASAIAAADRFIKLHPQHPNVDYAYYIKGLTNFNRGRSLVDRFLPKDPSERDPGSALLSFRDFEELVSKFPDSKYAPDAAQRMLFLKDTLAKHEIHVAQYYMRRGALVAAVNRAKTVVESYQGTTAVPDALGLMVEVYEKLDMPALAADARRVLAMNYPDHPAAR